MANRQRQDLSQWDQVFTTDVHGIGEQPYHHCVFMYLKRKLQFQITILQTYADDAKRFYWNNDPVLIGSSIHQFCCSKSRLHIPQTFDEFRQDRHGTFHAIYGDLICNDRRPLPIGDRYIVLKGKTFSEIFEDANTKAETHIGSGLVRRLVFEAAEEMSKEAFTLN